MFKTRITELFGIESPSRVVKNEVSLQVLEMEAKGATVEELMPLISGLRGRTVYGV